MLLETLTILAEAEKKAFAHVRTRFFEAVHLNLVQRRVVALFELAPEIAGTVRVFVDAQFERGVCGSPLNPLTRRFLLQVAHLSIQENCKTKHSPRCSGHE